MASGTGVRNKRGRCQIVYQLRGQRHYETLPIPYTEAGIASAIRVREQRVRSSKYGVSTREYKQAPTFAVLAQSFLDSADVTPATRQSYKVMLQRHWMPALHATPVDMITYSDLRKIDHAIAWRTQKYRKNALVPLRGVFDLGMADDWIENNPVTQFPRIKHQRPLTAPFTREERDEILRTLVGDAKVFYAIRFYCGLRPGEVIALRWSDYDGETLNVSKQIVQGHHMQQTKTHLRRLVNVHTFVRKQLQSLARPIRGGFIFTNQYGVPFQRPEPFAAVFVRTLKKLSIAYRSPYNCRHTCATMMLEAGADPAYCAKQLGHSLEMFFRTYADYINAEKMKVESSKVERYL